MDPPKAKKGRDGSDQVRGRSPELPDAQVLKKRLYARAYDWIRGHVGPRAAVRFAGLVTVLVALIGVLNAVGKLPEVGKSLELIPGASLVSELIHDRFHPIPKADPTRFSVALAHLQNDHGHNIEGFISRALKNFEDPLGIQFLQFDRTIDLKDQSKPSEEIGYEQARKYLKESGAQALIWGSAWTVNGKSEAQLYYATAEAEVTSAQAYHPEDFKLPAVDRQELTEVLGLLIATQVTEFVSQEGSPIADKLEPFISNVQLLLNGTASQDWDSDTRNNVKLLLGDALLAFGRQTDSADALNAAIAIYREELSRKNSELSPLSWAATQGNLGIALWTLGKDEANTTQLEQAVAAFHEAIKEFAREGATFESARNQLNLGNALLSLGKRESSPVRLKQAVRAFREALKGQTRERAPLDWAMAQNNLGTALKALGEWESSTPLIEEALAAYNEALKEFTRQRVPLYWAMTQNNMGSAFFELAKKESSATRFEQAVTAFRDALKEQTRERGPQKWAMLQSNLGNALAALAETKSNTTLLEEAVAAYEEALKEQTRDRIPLDWATTEESLGSSLATLGSIKLNATQLEQALVAFHEALKVQTRDSAPLDWARLHYRIGNALFVLGARKSNTKLLEQAFVVFNEALKVQTRDTAPVDWAWTQYSRGGTLLFLGEQKRNATMVCAGLGNFLGAWDVFSGAGPYHDAAPQAADAVRQSIAALKKLDRSVYSRCITKYSEILKRLNIVQPAHWSGGGITASRDSSSERTI